MSFQGSFKMKTTGAALALGVVMAGCSGGGATSNGSSSSSGGTSTTTGSTAADLIVTVDKSTIQDTGTDNATVTVTAVDANRNVVSGAAVKVIPDGDSVVTPSGTTTNAAGILTATLGVGSDKSNRTIKVIVQSGSVSKIVNVDVTGATLQATVGSANAGQTATIQYHLVDAVSANIPNAALTITLNGTAQPAAVTDSNGKYTFSYTVPQTDKLTVVGTADNSPVTSLITTSVGTTANATGTVTSASLAANPSSVNINSAGSVTNQVDVRANLLSAGNIPVQYARVRFDLDGDVSDTGGTLTSGTDYVYSDGNGVARTTYIPGNRSSGNQQVTIRACYNETDFPAGTCPKNVTTNLTVVDSGVSISVFTDGLITAPPTKSIYQVNFTVQVVDSAGKPIQGASIGSVLKLPRFYRGYYMVTGGAWKMAYTDSQGTVIPGPENVCDNEDINGNTSLDNFAGGATEDENGTGKLEPYVADALIAPASSGTDVTDAFGRAYFVLQYGQNVASWDDFTLMFSTTVQGSEGQVPYSGTLMVPAAVVDATSASPPFQISPYNFAPINEVPFPVQVVHVTDPVSLKSGNLCGKQLP